jgi:hypothetical protein
MFKNLSKPVKIGVIVLGTILIYLLSVKNTINKLVENHNYKAVLEQMNQFVVPPKMNSYSKDSFVREFISIMSGLTTKTGLNITKLNPPVKEVVNHLEIEAYSVELSGSYIQFIDFINLFPEFDFSGCIKSIHFLKQKENFGKKEELRALLYIQRINR